MFKNIFDINMENVFLEILYWGENNFIIKGRFIENIQNWKNWVFVRFLA